MTSDSNRFCYHWNKACQGIYLFAGVYDILKDQYLYCLSNCLRNSKYHCEFIQICRLVLINAANHNILIITRSISTQQDSTNGRSSISLFPEDTMTIVSTCLNLESHGKTSL